MARRRFFVSQIRNQQAEITGEEAHHLTRVLRVEEGQVYEISDGNQAYLAEVAEARKSRVGFAVRERLEESPLPVRLTVLAGLIKFDHFEWTLEKCTEAGAERFVPVLCTRSEKGLDRAVDKRRQRWERILLEASQQSRRDRIPALDDPVRFADAVAMPGDVRLILEEQAGARPLLEAIPEPERRMSQDQVLLLVGPEGGWTEEERELAARGQWLPVSLGRQILRAETAALAGAAIVSAAWQAVNPR
ncbi:MAG: 16S rRNA (uracil(1498)-N(3))-methyltransferase [Acidobacteria bacterium]|nr:16S rRNA (uracil(1498)-N(3))-methyltransferase [Acidobacteriota bacterium]